MDRNDKRKGDLTTAFDAQVSAFKKLTPRNFLAAWAWQCRGVALATHLRVDNISFRFRSILWTKWGNLVIFLG